MAEEEKTEVVEEVAEETSEAVEEVAEEASASANNAVTTVETKVEEAVSAPAPKKPAASKVPIYVAIIAAVVALLVGFACGKFIPIGGGAAASSPVTGKTTLTEQELDTVMGTYSFNGQNYTITAREAIQDNSSLEAAKQDDGSYTVPSADYILSSARNGILSKEVEAQGITVSDEDVDAYAESTLGSTDYATIASQYSMSEDQVKTILKQSCGVKKLYDSIVGTTDAGTAPEAPTAPAEGAEETPTAEYGAYIVALLGDEWDAEKDTWARTDGPYYASMSSMEFTSKSATYSQAETAYYVAYQAYSQTASDASSKWTEYLNGLLAKATISISTLVS